MCFQRTKEKYKIVSKGTKEALRCVRANDGLIQKLCQCPITYFINLKQYRPVF